MDVWDKVPCVRSVMNLHPLLRICLKLVWHALLEALFVGTPLVETSGDIGATTLNTPPGIIFLIFERTLNSYLQYWGNLLFPFLSNLFFAWIAVRSTEVEFTFSIIITEDIRKFWSILTSHAFPAPKGPAARISADSLEFRVQRPLNRSRPFLSPHLIRERRLQHFCELTDQMRSELMIFSDVASEPPVKKRKLRKKKSFRRRNVREVIWAFLADWDIMQNQ